MLIFSNLFYFYLEDRIPSFLVSLYVSSSPFCVFYYMVLNFPLLFLLFPSLHHLQDMPSLLWFFSRITAFPKLPLSLHIFWLLAHDQSMNTMDYQFSVCVQYVYLCYFTFWKWLSMFHLNIMLPSFLCHGAFPASPFFFLFFLRFYAFTFRDWGREGKGTERTLMWERNIFWLPLQCILTGKQICSPEMCLAQESKDNLLPCRTTSNQLVNTDHGSISFQAFGTDRPRTSWLLFTVEISLFSSV